MRRTSWSVVAVTAATVLTLAPDAGAAPTRPPVRAAAASTEGSTTVQLRWHNPGNHRFEATAVRYAKGTTAPRTPTSGKRAGRVADPGHTLTVRHLAPATKYTFSLFAAYGHGQYGRRVTVHITTAPAPVRHAQTFDHGSYVSVNWHNPAASTFAATVVRYMPGYHAPKSPTAGIGVPLALARAIGARLPKLAAHTAYSVSIWTRDSRHRYSSVTTAHFTTLGSAAPPPSGTLSGTVRDTDGHPLAGVEVVAFNAAIFSLTPPAAATTDGAGHYHLVVPAGADIMGFGGQRITGGNSDATGYVADPVNVTVPAGGTKQADETLHAGAAVSGRVTDSAGNPLHNVTVYPQAPDPYVPSGGGWSVFRSSDPSGAPYTAADGAFTIKGLPDDALQICYDTSTLPVSGGTSDAVGYLGRCERTTFKAKPGTATTLAPMALVRGSDATVVGTVTDSHGAPARGTFVTVTAEDPNADGWAGVTTADDGTFRAGGLPAGRYDVCAEAVPGGSTSGNPGDAPTCRPGVVTVLAGQTSHADVRLNRGGGAAGRLVGPSGKPVVHALVMVSPAGNDGTRGGAAFTDARGQFVVSNLPPGKYTVCFDATYGRTAGAATGAQPACLASSFDVKGGLIRLGLDTRLAAGGSVSGTVRDASGKPVAHADVEVESATDAEDGGVWSVSADASGRYAITGLAPGRYLLCASTEDAALSDFLGGPCTGTAVTVRAGRNRVVDLAVPPAGSITVTVRDADNHPVAGADVVAVAPCPNPDDCDVVPLFSAQPAVVADSEMTDGTGSVTLTGLPPGKYALCAFTYYAAADVTPGTGYTDRCTSSGTFGTSVANGGDPAVALTLQPGGAVSGRITDTAGHPLAGVHLLVSDSTSTDYAGPNADDAFSSPAGPQADAVTDADGTYTIRGVRPGNRTVCVQAEGALDTAGTTSPTGYLSQCVGGTPGSTTGGTPVAVSLGNTTTGVDLKLTKGAGIKGTVTDSTTKRGVTEVEVIAFDSKGQPADFELSDGGGHYQLTQLPPGAFTVCFSAGRYQPQCYDGVPWKLALPTGTKPVATTPGVVSGPVDARLRRI